MSKLNVNLDMVRKYNVAGPRYTSYPPATLFSGKTRWAQLADEIIANNKEPRDLSLYFHLPFCKTLCWYCGCNTVITTDQSQSAKYLDYLEKELKQAAAYMHPERKVVQIHFGGGTPTFLQPAEILRLGQMIYDHFKIAPNLEASVEIDPRRLTRQHIAALRQLGFKRASLGVQDFNAGVQEAVHRIQPYEMTARCVRWLREFGFKSLNIDLIYGLPLQTVASFSETLEQVRTLDPDRLALFSYAHVPWMKPSQKILEKNLPAPEDKLQIFKMAAETLTSRDEFVYIGMDHFAKPLDDLTLAQRSRKLHRNFQGYSTHEGADIYAFGISGISQTDGAYWQNEKDLVGYYAALDSGKSTIAKGYIVSEDDKIRRDTIMRIMCDLRLNFSTIEEKHGIDFPQYFARELESLAPMEEDGLLRFTSGGLEVSSLGRLLVRNIAMQFDAYYGQETEKRFSRTI